MDFVSKIKSICTQLGVENPRHITPLTGGVVNPTFNAGERLIFRFNIRDKNFPKFSRECFAYKKCYEFGIKVPKVLFYQRKEEIELLVLERLTGSPIAEIWEQAQNKNEIIASVCDQLKLIHNISLSKFGFYGDGETQYDYWDEFNFMRLKKHLEECRASDIELDEIRIYNRFERDRSFLRNYKTPTLVHNDFHLGNIMYENGVQGILDWEWSMGGDPLIDFQCIQDWVYDWPGSREILWECYQIDWPLSGDAKKRFELYELISTIEMLWVTKRHFLKYEWGQQQYKEKEDKLLALLI